MCPLLSSLPLFPHLLHSFIRAWEVRWKFVSESNGSPDALELSLEPSHLPFELLAPTLLYCASCAERGFRFTKSSYLNLLKSIEAGPLEYSGERGREK